MAKLYIAEYSNLGVTVNGFTAQIASESDAVVDQPPVAIGGSHAESAAFATNTKMIRVHTDAICSIVIGSAPAATTNNKRMAADQTEYFGVKPGDKISVIANT